MGGEMELTARMMVVQLWHLSSMMVEVDGGSGDGFVATTIGKDTMTMQ